MSIPSNLKISGSNAVTQGQNIQSSEQKKPQNMLSEAQIQNTSECSITSICTYVNTTVRSLFCCDEREYNQASAHEDDEAISIESISMQDEKLSISSIETHATSETKYEQQEQDLEFDAFERAASKLTKEQVDKLLDASDLIKHNSLAISAEDLDLETIFWISSRRPVLTAVRKAPRTPY